jgi:hypothetical protein
MRTEIQDTQFSKYHKVTDYTEPPCTEYAGAQTPGTFLLGLKLVITNRHSNFINTYKFLPKNILFIKGLFNSTILCTIAAL